MKRLLQREFLRLWREQWVFWTVLLLPALMVLLFGSVVTTDIRGTRVAVLDNSHDALTQQLTQRFDQNPYFTVTHRLTSYEQLDNLMRHDRIDIALVFGNDFAADMMHMQEVNLQILVDGTDNQAAMRASYAERLIQEWQRELMMQSGTRPQFMIVPQMQMLYNPYQRGDINIVPGAISLLLLLMCTLVTCLAFRGHGEWKRLRDLYPVTPPKLVAAKLMPPFCLCFVSWLLMLFAAVVLLHIPMSFGVFCSLLLGTCIYMLTSLLLGLLISCISRSNTMALLLAGMVLMGLSILLSGMMFPVESMPTWLQYIADLIPAKWYTDLLRRLWLTPAPMVAVAKETLILCAFLLINFLAVMGQIVKNLTAKWSNSVSGPSAERSDSPKDGLASIKSDFFLPKLFIALPIILLLIMPFAAQQDFRQMGVVVVDRDHSSSSARLIQKVDASRTFRVVEVLPNEIDAQPLLDYGKADFMLDIPQDFERDLFSAMTSANISGNSVNMMKGGLGSGYLTNIVMEFASEIRMENISRSSVPVRPVTFNIPTRYMYNQRADLKLFMLPVLLVILMTLLAGFVPAVHPAHPVAYYLICEVVLWFAIALGALLLGIPALQPFSVGGLGSFILSTFILSTCYIFLWLGIARVARRVARRPLQAMLTMLFVIMCSIVLSGLFTPVSAMPTWAQYLSRLNPMQYMLQAMRIICLKG